MEATTRLRLDIDVNDLYLPVRNPAKRSSMEIAVPMREALDLLRICAPHLNKKSAVNRLHPQYELHQT